jgi:hypothetical protein
VAEAAKQDQKAEIIARNIFEVVGEHWVLEGVCKDLARSDWMLGEEGAEGGNDQRIWSDLPCSARLIPAI